MKKFSIIFSADISAEQIREFAESNNISIEAMVVASVEEPETITETPITGEILEAVASKTDKTVLEVAEMASNMGITTLEEALSSSEVPSEVKSIIEELI